MLKQNPAWFIGFVGLTKAIPSLWMMALVLGVACTPRAVPRGAEPTPTVESVASGTKEVSLAPAQGVEMTRLSEGVWLHTSYKSLPGIGLFPTNGLVVRVKGGLFLIDTAWNDEQTRAIGEWAQTELSSSIQAGLVTHAHDDKMGGVKALHEMGVQTYALRETNEAAKGRGLHATTHTLSFENGLEVLADGAVEAFYPGAGHTEDNIVVYLKEAKILFGGCLIRPAQSTSLGNTADADIDHWDAAVMEVKARYGDALYAIPSHGPPGGVELLDHTISLVQQHRAKVRAE